MPKKGLEYIHSSQKRNLDRAIVALATPALSGALVVVKRVVPAGQTPVFYQERVGQNVVPFTIRKLRTRDANTGESLGRITDFMRRAGVDELAQLTNIKDEKMSVTGWRPLMADPRDARLEDTTYEEYWDYLTVRQKKEHQTVVVPTRNGVVSSYGNWEHFGVKPPDLTKETKCQQQHEANMRDIKDASLAHDLHLLGNFLALSALRLAHNLRSPVEVAESEALSIPLQREEPDPVYEAVMMGYGL